MEAKTIFAICRSWGEFVADGDGLLSYRGGEAFVVDVDEQMKLHDFKSEIAECFKCDSSAMALKYFLPCNKKTLITISKDLDLQFMVSFLDDASTVDVFVSFKEAAAPPFSNIPDSRSSGMPVSEDAVPETAYFYDTNKMHQPDVPCVTPIRSIPFNPRDEEHCKAAETSYFYDTNGMHEADVPCVTPIRSIPLDPTNEKHRKAAQHWENLIKGVGQKFNSINEFQEALRKYSMAHGFAFKYQKNDSLRVSVKCKVQGCPWRICASVLPSTQLVCIEKMDAEHTCEGDAAKSGYDAGKGWLAKVMREKVKFNPNCNPEDIVDDVRRDHGIEMSYSQAQRAIEMTKQQLQGFCKYAYNLLPYVCKRIKESNPGSIATLATKADSSFYRLFIAFHASITGFKHGCRPLIFLDRALINSEYQSILFVAIATDSEGGIFPIAFAIVDAENEDNWHWFLQELKCAITSSRCSQITFVADFVNGLKNALAEVFSKCCHSYCILRLAEKLIRDVKEQLSHEARMYMVSDFYAVASAPTIEGFQRAAETIKGVSCEAYDWILASEPEHWANAFFVGKRYNHMTSNFGQEFYSWVSEANELPITEIIDILRGKMMDSIYKHRVDANECTTKLTPSNEEKLQIEVDKARSRALKVLPAPGNAFEVFGAGESVDFVDIDHWDCSCKGWQLTGLPCCHAIAVLEHIGRSPYDFCSQYFTVKSYRSAYAETIYPVPSVDRLIQSGAKDGLVTVMPPATKR